MLHRRTKCHPWRLRPLIVSTSNSKSTKKRIPVINSVRESRRSLYSLRICGFVAIVVVIVLLHRKEHEFDEDAQVEFAPDPFLTGVNGSSKNVVLERPGYLVWTPSCRIPVRDAFDKSIRQFLKPAEPIVCSDKPPLTYVAPENDPTQGNYVLHVNESTIPYYVRSGEDVSCCYSNITRFENPAGRQYGVNQDNRFNISLCANFKKKVKLLSEEEFILVKCKKDKLEKQEDEEIYINMHGVVPIKKTVKEHRKKRKVTDADDDRLNVLILVYDSMSQLNLIRTMPTTVQYLNQTGFVNIHGYNIVGDATFPNAMAMLTGLSLSSIQQECQSSSKMNIDECPFVWKDYNKHGYVTAYVEDTDEATFNIRSEGFLDPPTDYYFRPYILGANKYLEKKAFAGYDVCFGPESATDHVMKYLLHFVSTLQNYLYFALVWMNNFCHNDLNLPLAMDQRTVQLLQDLNKTNVYNNTLVIFMSDHGARFGDIRATFQGWMEERMPYVYFLFPKWYIRKYAPLYQNLLTNRKRLTSHYDLHVTLKHLLSIPEKTKVDNTNVSHGCPHGKSLLLQDVNDRTCEEAGITPNYCSCNLQYLEMPKNDKKIIKAVKYIMRDIHKKFSENTEAQQCSTLTVKQVVQAKVKMNTVRYNLNHHYDYLIIHETQPGGALFESTVQYFTRKKKFFLEGSIKRINSYGNQSECVKNSELKLYCYCRNLLQ